MPKWVRINSQNNHIIEYLECLPSSYQNISNFPKYENPAEYGFYSLIENIPPYDTAYQRLSEINRYIKNGCLIIDYTPIYFPLTDLKTNLKSNASRLKKALETRGFLFKDKFYSSGKQEYDALTNILSGLPESDKEKVYWKDTEGYPVEFSVPELKDLNKEMGEHRSLINDAMTKVLSDIQDIKNTDDVKIVDSLIKKILHQGVSLTNTWVKTMRNQT